MRFCTTAEAIISADAANAISCETLPSPYILVIKEYLWVIPKQKGTQREGAKIDQDHYQL